MSDWQINLGNANPPAKSGGKFAMVFLFIFALPFAGFGIFALAQAFHQFNTGKTKDAIALILFGLIFSAVGFGLMFGTVWARKKVKQADAQQTRNPDKPWFWRADWAEGRVKSANKQAAVFLWIFALFWNAISIFPIIFLPNELHKGNRAAWIGLIFPLVGVGLLIAAVRTTLAWRRFGQCVFEMAAIPGALGGTLEGMIQVGARLQAEHGLLLRLSCVRRTTTGSGKSRSTSESVLWQDEKWLRADLPEPEPARTGVPVYFKLPADQPESTASDGDGIHWKLEASAKVRGPNFSATFDVPVFKIADADIAGENDTDPTALYQMSLDDVRAQIHSRIRVNDAPGGGKEFYFPAARNPGTAIFLTLFTAIFGGAEWFLIRQHAPIIFPIAFGIATFFLVIGTFNTWFKSSRITVDSTGVTAVNRWLIFSRTRRFDAGGITRFATKVGMTSGTKTFHDLKLVTPDSAETFQMRKAKYQQTGQMPPMEFKITDPGGITLAASIASKTEADWLVEQMAAALGKNDAKISRQPI